MANELPDRFCYVYSCDLDVHVQIKIGTLEGQRERPSYRDLINDPMLPFSGAYQDGCSDLFVTCQVYSDNKPLALPVSTSYKAFSTRWNWNEWLTLPIKYSDLPRDARIGLTVWDIYGPQKQLPVGGTTLSLFCNNGSFRQGMMDLKLWPHVECDGQMPTTTPGKSDDPNDQMTQLAKLSKKHRDGHIIKVDWLDRLTFREIEMINEKQKRDSKFMYIMVEFQQIHFEGTDFDVVYFEKDADEVYPYRTQADIVLIPDPEILQENLVESKHHKLARSLRSGPSDRDLKPNAANRDQLNTIVAYSPTKALTSEEQDLVWKFRFYLSSQKKALTKFLKCVNWSLPQEEKMALELLVKWSPMDVEDALELLSPAFTHPSVRKYAITRLQVADDEDLLLYLLQLVQALKYENFKEINSGLNADTFLAPRKESSNVQVPVVAVADAEELERHDDESDPLQRDSVLADLVAEADSPQQTKVDEEMDLATFLIYRSSNNFTLANYFYWYLMVESDTQDSNGKDSRVTEMYMTVLKRFLTAKAKTVNGLPMRSVIHSQRLFMDCLVSVVKAVARESGNRKKKIEKLQSLLHEAEGEGSRFTFSNFEPIPLPLDPDQTIKSIVPEKAILFKSALMPSRLTFMTTNNEEYTTIFKHGDDLRQDQLILQMISLMDKLLRRENLDLKLTPYKCLATSSRHGFVQFVDAIPIAEILDKEGSIQNFFRKHNPSETGPFGFSPDVMDSYVKSCAGYCVITYLLGVGDRHLDNLMVSTTGKLVHIDFGYILGRDPKPLPPPMKLSKEMVDAMGGVTSEHFHDFKKMCYTAFLHLRRSSNLILNLFSLMLDASVPDIALEPDKTVKKVQDKFQLHLTDEAAVQYMQNLIESSVSALMPAFVEQMHKFAQYWRK